jgi:UDP:flavonoid glycosyltransferase YjiC (YdhE family)
MLTVGSRGDVQPYVALGRGLQAAGHHVRMATHVEFEGFVRGHGLDFAVIPGNPMGVLRQNDGQPPADTRPFQQIFAEYLRNWTQACLEASAEADVIIYSQLCFIGSYVAEKLGRPCYGAYHTPVTPTSQFPTVYGRGPRKLGGPYNWLSHIIDQQIFWHGHRAMLNQLRRDTLDMPPLAFVNGHFGGLHQRQVPILYGYSPAVMPRPADWTPWIHVTGYWFLERASDWQPPADLVDFLSRGPAPVYLGLGSVADNAPAHIMRELLRGLKLAGVRAIVLPGKFDLAAAELPEETFVIGSTAFDWLFPQLAGVIFHGGPGTLAYALRAGVPTLAIPFFGDQPFWGRRVAELGVGPPPIPCTAVRAEDVAAAVTTMVTSSAMRQRATSLAQAIQQEDGVRTAVDAVHQHMNK